MFIASSDDEGVDVTASSQPHHERTETVDRVIANSTRRKHVLADCTNKVYTPIR